MFSLSHATRVWQKKQMQIREYINIKLKIYLLYSYRRLIISISNAAWVSLCENNESQVLLKLAACSGAFKTQKRPTGRKKWVFPELFPAAHLHIETKLFCLFVSKFHIFNRSEKSWGDKKSVMPTMITNYADYQNNPSGSFQDPRANISTLPFTNLLTCSWA